MLKQILTTSALIAIAAISVQSANAADLTKFRQLVVEPTAAPVTAAAVDPAAHKRQRLLVAPTESIPTETADAGHAAQFVLAPSQGLETPAGIGDEGKTKETFPSLTKASGGIATPVKFSETGSDPIQATGSKTFPLIASAPSGLTTPPDVAGETADATPVDAAPVAKTKAVASVEPIVSASPERQADAPRSASIAADTAPTAVSIANPGELYSLLTGRGFGVQILKRDAYGNLVFYVTIPGKVEADLLLVDGTYGKVIKRRHLDGHPAPYTPSYATAYADKENCDHTAGY
jgi:hypothetical protein